MTIISTLISESCVAHASESLLSKRGRTGNVDPVEGRSTKIVRVDAFAGAISYFGLAVLPGDLRTLSWLREQASEAGNFQTPSDFANHLQDNLQGMIQVSRYRNPIDAGIGLHFSAYENIDGAKVPELFSITNFASTDYQSLHPDGIHLARETFRTLRTLYNAADPNNSPYLTDNSPVSEHGNVYYRKEVLVALQNGTILIYNNGNPLLFNPASGALFQMIRTAQQMRILRQITPRALRKMAQFPINYAVMVQNEFFVKGYRTVGGRGHNLSVTPDGKYDSDTRDHEVGI